ncbi:MAG TPA: Ig-like domain-containing protein [Gemmatimonadaceae bacterium]|jgi:hypothetical protein|nr:Ig-like domain-containing protein [Gemmatimonadaceae bacterium]
MMRAPRFVASMAVLALAIACGGDTSGPKVGPAAKIVVSSAPAGTGAVKQDVGSFVVLVTDANEHPVQGAAVSFAAAGGGGVVLTPSGAITDASGLATTKITLGTRSEPVQITARVNGVAGTVSVSVATTPGPAATIEVTPGSLRFRKVGDSFLLTSLVKDQYANPIVASLAYTVADPSLVSVDGAGRVTALRAGDTTTIEVLADARADTVAVRVLAPGESPCTGLAAPTTLAVGGAFTATGATACIGADPSAPTEYTVVAYNASPDGSSGTFATVIASGVDPAPSAARLPARSLLASRTVLPPPSPLGTLAPVLRRDDDFHLRLLEDSRALRRLFGAARTTRADRLARRASPGGGFTPSASYSAIPSSAQVGDRVQLNVSDESCTGAIMHGFRVVAIGAGVVVLADTLNPADGFTSADYQRFADRFDAVVYPVDVGSFGAPSDLDGNGKVAVLFTEHVNEMTPANATSYIGGFFHPRDLFPRSPTNGLDGCPTSNQGEMFYMLVPDPTGTINGNRRSIAFVDTTTVSVLAHEFQHLINAGRRLYVNTGAQDFEETWLNEGLSHVAEELLYFRESGMQPRQNYGDQEIRADPSKYAIWKADASSNFARLLEYIQGPANASPLDPDDALATRGATWAFLRYAVDRLFPTDDDVWARFDDSIDTGLLTLQRALLTDGRPILADFAVANYVDDLGISSDPRFVHRTWNYRSIFSNTFGTRSGGVFTPLGYYPLPTSGLADDVSSSVFVRGGSATYFRMTVPAGGDVLLSFAPNQNAPDPSLSFTVVRTR